MVLNDLRTPVTFWGQTTPISNSLSPKRDCGPNSPTTVARAELAQGCGRFSALWIFHNGKEGCQFRPTKEAFSGVSGLIEREREPSGNVKHLILMLDCSAQAVVEKKTRKRPPKNHRTYIYKMKNKNIKQL